MEKADLDCYFQNVIIFVVQNLFMFIWSVTRNKSKTHGLICVSIYMRMSLHRWFGQSCALIESSSFELKKKLNLHKFHLEMKCVIFHFLPICLCVCVCVWDQFTYIFSTSFFSSLSRRRRSRRRKMPSQSNRFCRSNFFVMTGFYICYLSRGNFIFVCSDKKKKKKKKKGKNAHQQMSRNQNLTKILIKQSTVIVYLSSSSVCYPLHQMIFCSKFWFLFFSISFSLA